MQYPKHTHTHEHTHTHTHTHTCNGAKLMSTSISRSLSGVRGITRETLIALTTTIESCEWMRRRRASDGLAPEHPRASSTDNIECLFSVLRKALTLPPNL